MGTLYVVGSPIGNMEDITLRALRILKEVALIAAEDTRYTRLLLDRYGIKTPLTSYHEHNKLKKLGYVMEKLQEGDVALVSDAGMPGLSDPGDVLIRRAIEQGVPVVPIPGPSALVTALVISGLPADSFLYLGFLPRRQAARRKLLAAIAGERRTLVAFEAPHRLLESLSDLAEVLGERQVAVARELTKLHEEVWRGTAAQALAHFHENQPRGEITLVIAGAQGGEVWDEERVREALGKLIEAGIKRKDAARQVAQESGWSAREVYRLAE